MNWFSMVWLAAAALCLFQHANAGILDVKAISPEIAVLSGNRNRGNGITKNQVGGNQETVERLETYEGPASGVAGGGGGLLGGLV